MKVSNGEIWEARPALQNIITREWPVKTAYWLTRLTSKLAEQYLVVNEVRTKLLRQYGTEDGKGGVAISPEHENWPRFAAEYQELMDFEVEMPIDRKILLPLPKENDKEQQITPLDLFKLRSFVDLPEEP